jgi:putative DNA primase/helicase
MIEQVLGVLDGVTRHEDYCMARCPAHEDRRPSLKISERGGKILLYCYAGCQGQQIVDRLRELGGWPNQSPVPSVDDAAFLVDAYPYQNETGEVVYTIQRMSNKQFYPLLPDGRKTLQGVERVPYRLPELLKSRSVILVEGEKDVHTVERLGLVATTTAGGTKSWKREVYARHFQGKRVAIIPDNDDPGREYAVRVMEDLRGIAEMVKIIQLPELKPKQDISDWVRGYEDEEAKSVLIKLIQRAPEWMLPAPSSLLRIADVAPREVSFAWEPYLPLGKVTLIDGDPGIGKSFLTCAIATGLSLGRGLRGKHIGPTQTLLMCREDDADDTIRPRLEAMRADLGRVFVYGDELEFTGPGLRKVRELISTCGAKVIFFDPLSQYFGEKLDLHRANQVRPVMTELKEISRQYNCSIVGIRHLTKGSGQKGQKAIHRGYGSIDLLAAARSVLMVVKGDKQHSPYSRFPAEEIRTIFHIKSNLAQSAPPLNYTIIGDQFIWLTDERQAVSADGSLSTTAQPAGDGIDWADSF